MSMMTAAARWLAGKRDLTADVARIDAALKATEKPPNSIDPAEHQRWEDNRDALRRELRHAEAALAIATVEVAKAEAAQREAGVDAENAAVAKRARNTVPLVKKAGRLIDELHATILEIEEQRKAVEEANRNRGNRPHIADAETLARQIPGRTVPEKLRKDVIWVNANGDRATFFRKDESGELVPADGSYRRTVVDVLESAEERIPPRTPLRYARALTLVDPAGNPLRLD